VSAALEALHVTVAEKLSGIRLVKVRVREREEADAYRGQVRELTSVLMTLNRQKEALEVAIEPTMILGAFCALYASVRWFGMTLASVSVVMLILLRLVPYLKQMTTAGQLFGALMASLEDVQNVVDTARKARTITSGPITFGGLARDVRFDRVGFRYQDSPDRWAVRDASFTLTRGTLTALVGRSGAGKSTTLDLIARLRDPVEGEILFDGVPASRFTLTSLRSAVGIVDQDGFLFHDTVASNIACGLSGVSSSDIAAAARRAHADEFITQLPRGYDTLIGDRGVRLSGGQRQRLSLARVILQNPDILLLDEPTSALDAESEELIQDALEALRRTKVVVVAAHRLSTVRRASQILVLEDGGIVERGDHTSLMTEEGIYRRLFDLQIHV
jgi:subfamily B ATP-binding cassette protein MsbA